MQGAEWVICESKERERSRRARPRNGARNAGLEVVMVESDKLISNLCRYGPGDWSMLTRSV